MITDERLAQIRKLAETVPELLDEIDRLSGGVAAERARCAELVEMLGADALMYIRRGDPA